MLLTQDDGRILLHLARRTLDSTVRGIALPALDPIPSPLDRPRGAFVTLFSDDDLRGCIGSVHASQPLWETVRTMTVSSATRDPRFEPVAVRELDSITIHVSVLTPLARIDRLSEIEVGRHGLYVRNGLRTGVLLPQVGSRYGWTAERFFQETLRKAGLDPHRTAFDLCEVFVYQAQEFA